MDNYIGRLQEYAVSKRHTLDYEDLGSVGPDHNKTFTQRVVLNGKSYPDGVGKNKRDAKQRAAKNALEYLENEHHNPVSSAEKAAEASAAPARETTISSINYICWVNEYGQKNRLTVRPVESTGVGANKTVHFVVGNIVYPMGTGETKREAKEEAAKLVYDVIHENRTMETVEETVEENSYNTQQQEESNGSVSDVFNRRRSLGVNSNNSFAETNYIGIVNHYLQKTNSSHKYIEVKRLGPPDKHQFFYKLMINDEAYPVGQGKSIKEAKQHAAQLAWSALQEQSDWDSKVSVRSTASDDGAQPMPSTRTAPLESHDSSQQSTSMSTSDSIVFANSSNGSNAQTVSEDDASNRESLLSSQSMSADASSSGVFTNSWNISRNKAVINGQTSAQSRFASDFYLMEDLGRGAFGVVYKARHKLLEMDYAVKVVRCEEKSLREVGTLSELQHANIVRYYTFWMEDSGQEGDVSGSSGSSSQSTHNPSSKYLYIQMELCDKRTLKLWINEKNEQSLETSKRREESLSIATQLVEGVEYIHLKKHIHRDLKPDNILFGLDGALKIGDFGLVTRDDDLVDRTLERGTPTYMAPEQRVARNYDRKVDIFPLGLIYLELLWKLSTGHERSQILHDARCQRFPKEFSRTFPEEHKIIKGMLCEKPEERPEASTLRAELEKLTEAMNALKLRLRNVTV